MLAIEIGALSYPLQDSWLAMTLAFAR